MELAATLATSRRMKNSSVFPLLEIQQNMKIDDATGRVVKNAKSRRRDPSLDLWSLIVLVMPTLCCSRTMNAQSDWPTSAATQAACVTPRSVKLIAITLKNYKSHGRFALVESISERSEFLNPMYAAHH
ncbi:MAG: hypothetical protein WKF84_10195 [Pyrinomonadaceae bacterium]